MGVLVCYDDFTYDVINDYHLDFLIESGCITGYDKSGEWVRIEGLPSLRQQDSKKQRDQLSQSRG